MEGVKAYVDHSLGTLAVARGRRFAGCGDGGGAVVKLNAVPTRELSGHLPGKGRGKVILPRLHDDLDFNVSVELGEAVRAERRRPLAFKDNPGPKVRGVGRNERFTFPPKGQGKGAGREADPIFQLVIQRRHRFPLR